MKYRVYEWVAFLVFAIAIIATKDIPIVFGVVIGVSLTLYAYLVNYCITKRDEARAEKDYQKWQAEMNERANRNAPSKYDW